MMKRIYSLISFVLLLAIYFLTAYPDLTYTDSGELAAVATTLGIAHPTGYPLYTILAHIWTYLPISSSPVYELNLFSGFLTAFSGVILFFTSRELLGEKNTFLAFIISLIYGLGNVVWGQALSVEVYPLHLLLVNLILLFSVKFYRSNKNSHFFLAILFFSLSFGNHLTTILFLPSMILLIFRARKKRVLNSLKDWIVLFLIALSGLASYLFLYFNSMQNPTFNWGDVARGFDKFLYHVQGKQYQIWMFSDGDAMKQNILTFFKMFPLEMNFLLIFIPFGFFYLYKKSTFLFYYLLLTLVSVVIYASGYVIHDIAVYFAPALLIFEIFGIIGLSEVLVKRQKLTYLALIFPAISLLTNFRVNDHSDDRIVPEYVELVTKDLPENSIILSSQWDYWCSAFWYKQQIEGYREDLILIEKELLRRTWYPEQLLKWYPVLEKSRPEVEDYLKSLEKFESGEKFDPNELQVKFWFMLRSFTERFESDRNIYFSADILQTEKGFAPDHYKIPYGMLYEVLRPNKLFIDPKPSNYEIDEFAKMKRKYPSHLDEGIYALASQNFAANAYYQMSEENIDLAKAFAEKSLKLNDKNEIALKVLNAINKRNENK